MWCLDQFRIVDQINAEPPLRSLVMKANGNVSEALAFEAATVPQLRLAKICSSVTVPSRDFEEDRAGLQADLGHSQN
jgi:hypothetical protein